MATSSRPDHLQVRRYSFKLYPSPAQTAILERQCALLAQLWNGALEERETVYARLRQYGRAHDGAGHVIEKTPSAFDQARAIKVIRAQDPAWRELGAASMARCLEALDLAFKAFFRRVKQGGEGAGYPRYKRTAEHGTIWHRDGSGWAMRPDGKHWRVALFGVTDRRNPASWIRARGRFPAEPAAHRTMEVIRRDGAWWMSVVVWMPARRKAGSAALQIAFDLIDEFASVKAANGECLPGWEGGSEPPDERINPMFQGDDDDPDRAAPETGADGRCDVQNLDKAVDRAAPETGADGRQTTQRQRPRAGQAASTVGDDGRNSSNLDALQSAGDRRFKRFSIRWKREKQRIARMQARQARQRREALHRWTTRIVNAAAELLVVCPPIRESTRSARGDARRHGAAVKPVAMLNRHILAQAPAAAIAMLEYKAAEAAIPFARIEPDEHKVAIGRDLPAARRAGRKAARILKEEAA